MILKFLCIAIPWIFIVKTYMHGLRCKKFSDKKKFYTEYKISMGIVMLGILIEAILINALFLA